MKKNSVRLGLVITVLCIVSCKTTVAPRKGAESPKQLIDSYNGIIAQEDASIKLRPFIAPEDQAGWVGIQLMPLLMFDELFAAMGEFPDAKTKGAGSPLPKDTSSGGGDDLGEALATMATAFAEVSFKMFASLKKKYVALFDKHSIDREKLIGALNETDDFGKFSASIKKNLSHVDFDQLMLDVQGLNKALRDRGFESTRPDMRVLSAASLKINGDRATADFLDDAQRPVGTMVATKVDGRWYFSLRDLDHFLMFYVPEQNGDVSDETWEKDVKKRIVAAQKRLKKDSVGVWSGPFGNIEIKPDGAATFALNYCEEKTAGQGEVEFSTDCNIVTQQGTLEVGPWEFTMRDGTSGTMFAAYIDKQDRLHVKSIARVGYMGKDKRGKIALSSRQELLVGKKCWLADPDPDWRSKEETPCKWIEKNGKMLLLVDTPDNYDIFSKKKEAYIYLPDEELVVSPGIYQIAFERQVQ